jgi:hypothetical protein
MFGFKRAATMLKNLSGPRKGSGVLFGYFDPGGYKGPIEFLDRDVAVARPL